MKVVINSCFGGFGLSDKAKKLCIDRGMTVAPSDGDIYDNNVHDFIKISESDHGEYYINNNRDNNFRCNPIVIGVVEELGPEANSRFSRLKIVEIPFETPHGWSIDEYDGSESITENHRTWG